MGNELKIGDKVVYLSHCRTSSHLNKGVIDSLTSCTASIIDERGRSTRKNFDKIVKVG